MIRLPLALFVVWIVPAIRVQAQLPASAVDLTKVKITETQASTDLCPVHLVRCNPELPTWTHDGVEYRGHTDACQSEFEQSPEKFVEAARYQRWENNFIAAMSTVWCPVTDEVTGGFLKWEKLGLKWESCCNFCNATVNDNHFPAALERLKSRAKLAYEKTGGVYAVNVTDPIEDAVLGRSPAGRKPDEGDNQDLSNRSAGDLEPGLALTLTPLDGSPGDSRIARLPALIVAAGDSPSPFLNAGSFRADWRGYLRLDFDDELQFTADGGGVIRLRVGNTAVLVGTETDLSKLKPTSVALRAGLHSFELEYAALPDSDSSLRIFWDGIEFAREPVPAHVLSHEVNDVRLVQARQIRHGRQVFATHLCVRCHRARDDRAVTKSSMPELHAKAPSLRGVGSRLNTDWLAQWIGNPHQLRESSRMPAVLVGEDTDTQARDIAAYLSSLVDTDLDETLDTESWSKAEYVAVGNRLFDSIGCRACHGTCDDTNSARSDQLHLAGHDESMISLRDVAAKWKPVALRAFLIAPERHWAWTRMPNFRLSPLESQQLAAYLIDQSSDSTLAKSPIGDAKRGRELIATTGCMNCHEVPATFEENEYEAPDLANLEGLDWDRFGCAANIERRRDAPAFSFGVEQRTALVAFGSTDLRSLTRSVASEFTNRQFKELRCNACHARDGASALCEQLLPAGMQSVDPSVEKIGSPLPPALSHVGEQFRSEWLEKFLAGEIDYRVRPWLEIRMPSFPSRAKLLASGFAADHGVSRTSARPSNSLTDPAESKQAAKLFSSDAGFSCNKCHAIGNTKAQMDVEFGVIDLVHSRQRLRDDFYMQWMLNPTRVQAGTKMPAFTDQLGRSPLRNILDGDGPRQFDALWTYIDSANGENIAAPTIEAAIRSVLKTQQSAWNDGDIDRFMESYWKSDDLTFSSGGQVTSGWKRTLDNYKRRYPTRSDMGKLSFQELNVTPLGSHAAMVLGKWQLERESDSPGGVFTLVFRKINDNWVIVHDHTSRVEND